MKTHPKLLVSVRNAEEARAAIAGGCDILDLKEPHAGSLGRASEKTWDNIVDSLVNSGIDHVPLSLALGELKEFADVEQIPARIPQQTEFLKVGLSGVSYDWRALLSRFESHVEEVNGCHFQWVSVAYADFERAESPLIGEVLEHAVETSSPVFLLDTFLKDARTLFDWISINELQQIANTCATNDVQLAIAGRIGTEEFPQLKDIDFDILAVRSAVCELGQRTGPVTAQAVQSFRQAMEFNLLNDGRPALIEAETRSAD